MTVAPGARVGLYEILSAIGAGGMGEVFRARDTKLNRDVAIKVLPAEFANDHERVARFKREAQVLASLNHPNIAGIYGLEETGAGSGSETIVALIMELVEGEDLSTLIARGAIPVAEALPIARQIAEALEAAHEQGIVHRDLKPGNIKVRADGTVKVLDFGLAKAMDPSGAASANPNVSHSPTLTHQGTQAGMIIGTAAYMSPEQAKGKSVDKRADIWAFGVVLFEMLTGKRLFKGEDVSDTLAAVLRQDVDFTVLPSAAPRAVRRLVARCLDRDLKRRLRDIGEARVLLESPTPEDPEPAPSARGTRVISHSWLALTIAAAAIAGGLGWRAHAPIPAPEVRLAILPPTDAPPQVATISPDARKVAFVAGGKLWLRRLNQFAASEVAGGEGARTAFWSPDSSQIGFQAREQLWRVSIDGGLPIAIAPVPADFTPAGGAGWREDGTIVFGSGSSSLMEIKAEGGGAPRDLMTLDPAKDVDVHEPALLPGGAGVLFATHPASETDRAVQVLARGERRTVFSGKGRLSDPQYSSTGHVLFSMGTGVWAVPFSIKSMSPTGDPILVADNARRPSVASDGTIVLLSGNASTVLQLTWVDTAGKAGATISKLRATRPRISPDGNLVAAMVGFAGSGAEAHIWIVDVKQGTERRLTFESTRDAWPTWSPDGKLVVYECGDAACAKPADGMGARIQLLADAERPTLSPDGRRLLFRRVSAPSRIFSVDVDSKSLTAPILAPPKLVVEGRGLVDYDVSPDGHFLAYSTPEEGLFVTTFPPSESKWELPVSQPSEPRWSADGTRLFAIDGVGRLVEVPVNLKGTFTAGRPEVRVATMGARASDGYDRSRDGRSFLLPMPPSAIDSQARILVIQNWKPK